MVSTLWRCEQTCRGVGGLRSSLEAQSYMSAEERGLLALLSVRPVPGSRSIPVPGNPVSPYLYECQARRRQHPVGQGLPPWQRSLPHAPQARTVVATSNRRARWHRSHARARGEPARASAHERARQAKMMRARRPCGRCYLHFHVPNRCRTHQRKSNKLLSS